MSMRDTYPLNLKSLNKMFLVSYSLITVFTIIISIYILPTTYDFFIWWLALRHKEP